MDCTWTQTHRWVGEQPLRSLCEVTATWGAMKEQLEELVPYWPAASLSGRRWASSFPHRIVCPSRPRCRCLRTAHTEKVKHQKQSPHELTWRRNSPVGVAPAASQPPPSLYGTESPRPAVCSTHTHQTTNEMINNQATALISDVVYSVSTDAIWNPNFRV